MNTELLLTAIGIVVSIVGLMYAFLRNFKIDIKDSFKEMKDDIKEIKIDVKSIDQRLSKLEGSFTERGQWEGRLYSMQKIMKEEQK